MEAEARKRRIMVAYMIAAAIGVTIVQYYWATYSQIETIPYSQFEQLLNEDKIAEDCARQRGQAQRDAGRSRRRFAAQVPLLDLVPAQICEAAMRAVISVHNTLLGFINWLVPFVVSFLFFDRTEWITDGSATF